MSIPSGEKVDNLFELVKSMSKSEKRNFRLYAERFDSNRDAKFMRLFDIVDHLAEYDEEKLCKACEVSHRQLTSLKAHLYHQLLSSIRLLEVRHGEKMRLRQQLDFVHILYDKGLYRQCERLLEKARQQAEVIEDYTLSLEIAELEHSIDLLNVSKDMNTASDMAQRRVGEICKRIGNNQELANTFTKVYSLYLQLGYARTQKDLDLIRQYFEPRLKTYLGREEQLSFHERFYLYQAAAWYYYIQHNFVSSYRYSRKWVTLFEDNPVMKRVMYDNYLNGCSQILDGLFLMRKYRHFSENLARFERELVEMEKLNDNAFIIGRRILHLNKLNKAIIEGAFSEGLDQTAQIADFVEKHSAHLDLHYRMLLDYKIASLYFGEGKYRDCIEYLGRIIVTRDPRIRRDLQCFARILNLIASYEAGLDDNLDSQIRSVYAFLVKMNDLNAVQKEMLTFLKKLNSIYASELRRELRVLYERFKPYEEHPYERRAFYYLDLMSWLESKITGRTLKDIVRRKFIEGR